MRRSSLVAGCIFALALAGCRTAPAGNQTASTAAQQPAPTATQPPVTQTSTAQPVASTDSAPRISVDDAKTAIAAGNTVVVDVRTDAQWEAGHAKGALHIPEAELASHLSQLPKDKTIIAYCS